MSTTSMTATTKTSTSTSAAASTASSRVAGTVHNILRILNSRLSSEGNIKESKDVDFISELMKEAVKLVDKCMLLNVLLATGSSDILSTVLDNGGWTVLHNWLLDSKASDSRSFLIELLKLYKRLPVTVELLRQNSCAKDIKQLSKCPDAKVAGLSKSITNHWMDKVKEKSSSSSNNAGAVVAEATKRSDKSSSHADSLQNHRKSSSKSSSSLKQESSSRNSSTMKDSSSVKDSEDTDPSRVKTLCDSPDHISAKLNQRVLSADHSVVTSNIASSVASDDSSSSNNTESSSLTTTTVHRPKTVKTLGSKTMRSTGLELDDPLPPPKKKSLTQSSDKIPSKLLSNKKSVVDKKPTVSTTTSVTSSTSPSVASKAKPKVIPPRPPPERVFESSGFMDALSSTDIIPGRKKRKISTVTATKSSTSTAAVAPVSPDDKKAAPPSFYHETMEVSHDEKPDTAADSKSAPVDNSGTDAVAAVTDTNSVDMKTEEDASSVQQEQISNEDSSSNYSSSEPAAKKKKVKRVSWVDESKLCSYFYFQLDEAERVNVNRAKDFAETRKHEQEMEKQLMQNMRRMAHDTMSEKQEWRKPRLMTGLTGVTVAGSNSKERDIQREREQSILLVHYFSKNSIPDTAAEPEPEYHEFTEPRIIPLLDETGLGSEITYDSYTMTSTASTTSTQLPPAIANLLASTAPQPAVTNLPNNTPVTSPNPTTAPVVAPSSSAPLLPQPQSTPPPPQCNIPPLPVFLGMPLPVQQQIFQSVPVHIQQQMLSSLPPPLQNQLGPLMGSTGPNNALPFPDGVNPAGDMASQGMMPPMVRPRGPPPNFARRPAGPPPFIGVPCPDASRPQRPHMMRGSAPPHAGRVCTHFLAGNCRFGVACRKLHSPRDVGAAAGAVSPAQQESPR